MRLIKVNGMIEAVNKAIEIYAYGRNHLEAENIGLTAGRVGEMITKRISNNFSNTSNKSFFLTDERLNCSEKDKNSILFENSFNSNYIKKRNNFYTFQEGDLIDQNGRKFLTNEFFLDLCFLSLGEDGHLAGHFENSENKNDIFSTTCNAPKSPKDRMSFSLSFLKKTKHIVLCSIGNEKKNITEKFLNGEIFSSDIFMNNHNRIDVISDFMS